MQALAGPWGKILASFCCEGHLLWVAESDRQINVLTSRRVFRILSLSKGSNPKVAYETML